MIKNNSNWVHFDINLTCTNTMQMEMVKVISIFYFLSLRNLKDMSFRKLTVFLLVIFSCFEGVARIDVGRLSGLRVSRLSYHIQTSLCIRIPCDCRMIAFPLRWHHPRLWSAIKSRNIVRMLESHALHYIRYV